MVKSYDLDLDGDGRADLLFKPYSGGDVLVAWSGGDFHKPIYLAPAPSFIDLRFADLDGDHRSDLVFRSSAGTITAWMHGDASTAVTLGMVAPVTYLNGGYVGWDMFSGDFAGDGHDDLLFWNHQTGALVVWKDGDFHNAQGLGYVNASPGGNDTQLVVGDFDGDGKSDLLFDYRGVVVVWSSGDSTQAHYLGSGSGASLPATAADINGDGVDDLLVRYTYASAVWLGGVPQNTTLGPGNFRVNYYTADLDGDGKAEILQRSGSAVYGSEILVVSPTDFHTVGTVGTVSPELYPMFG